MHGNSFGVSSAVAVSGVLCFGSGPRRLTAGYLRCHGIAVKSSPASCSAHSNGRVIDRIDPHPAVSTLALVSGDDAQRHRGVDLGM